ncbi:myo-inosose-2 dehydratase [Lysinibacillus sp. FSL K6-0232]|uniref:myo-inosose-2 dehydratase n=1 Tax=Lysinibacillus sp. FSL K6-0232 TaxID=2921425 RepID=UPI0030FB5351
MLNKNDIQLGIAPIGWTNDDLPELGKEVTFEQCISEMALAGFIGCEIGNKFPKEPEILHAYLDIRGLQVASAWFSAYLTTAPYEETEQAFVKHRDFLHAMGAKVIVVSEQGKSIQGQQDVGVIRNKPEFTEEEWARLTNGLEQLGQLAKEKGMRIVYHHHMGTGIQNIPEIDRLMAETDPALVSLLFDCGHLYFAEQDYLAVLRKHGERIHHVHLKDVRADVLKKVKDDNLSFLDAVKAGVYTVPGDGDIDFQPIFTLLAEIGYKGWFVVEAEQDPAKANPFQYAKMARSYIEQLTGL